MAGLGADVGLREHGEAVALVRVGDPHLRAAQHVDAVGARRGGADRLQVGAAVGLGEREPAAQLGGRELREEVRALLVGAVAADELRHHQVRVDDAGERHPRARDGLDDAHVRARAEAEPAVLLGDGGGEEAELAHLLDHLARVLVGVLELEHVGHDVARQPALERVEQLVDGCVDGGVVGGGHGVPPWLSDRSPVDRGEYVRNRVRR